MAREEGRKPGRQDENWFGAPAFAQAWWQKEKMGVAVHIHDHRNMVFGTINQRCSQDLDLNTTAYAYRPIEAGRTEQFLSVLVPHKLTTPAGALVHVVKTSVSKKGRFVATLGGVKIEMDRKGNWSVRR